MNLSGTPKELNIEPNYVYSMSQNETVSVDGREFKVALGILQDDDVYLTSKDSRVAIYNNMVEEAYESCAGYPDYHDFITHIRAPSESRPNDPHAGPAVMPLAKLHQLLISKSYYVG